jgi:two-component system cell cycle response regulator DivK
LDLAQKVQLNLILMNPSLPGIDGWKIAWELKDDPNTTQIPLLALTVHTLPGERKREMEAGFDGYISKHRRRKVWREHNQNTKSQAGKWLIHPHY